MAVYALFFSPCGSSATLAKEAAQAIDPNFRPVQLADRFYEEPSFTPDDLVVVSGPVYAGRIPGPMADKLKTLKGNGARVLALSVYGNRAYEDALLETADLLSEAGFAVIAAGAFIARHVFVPEVAQGRPNANDLEEIRDLARKFAQKATTGTKERITVPGNRPYRDGMKVMVAPSVSAQNCCLCKACVHACPTGAIDKDDPTKVDISLCINCMRCVQICSEGKRDLPAKVKEMLHAKLSPLINVEKRNETFI